MIAERDRGRIVKRAGGIISDCKRVQVKRAGIRPRLSMENIKAATCEES